MAQQGKQMRVGACEGFAHHSVKVVLLANGNRYKVDSIKCFLNDKALYPFEISPSHTSDIFFFFYTHLYL